MKRLIGIILSLIVVISCIVPISVEADDEDRLVFNDVQYITLTDHYSKASGSASTQWSENGRFFTYRISIKSYVSKTNNQYINVEANRIDGVGEYNYIWDFIGCLHFESRCGSVRIPDQGTMSFYSGNDQTSDYGHIYIELWDRSTYSDNDRYASACIDIVDTDDRFFELYVFDNKVTIPIVKETGSVSNRLFGDVNKDNLVDVADAQMILNYYVYTLANSSAEPLEEWISKK